MAAAYKPKAGGHKKTDVTELDALFKKYPVIAVANLEGMPTAQLTAMRKKLRGQVHIRMAKKTLMKISLETAKKDKAGIEQLVPKLQGVPAIIFTNDNPFKLFKILERSKIKAAAKVGQKAPNDITLPAGPTPFAPGPMISELAGVGIKAGVEAGKISIKEAKVIVKEGQVIDSKVASLLAKFDIKPMAIGINLVAAYEGGMVYGKDILGVDETIYIDRMKLAASESFALAMELAYATKDTMPQLIAKAFRNTKAVGYECNILTKDTTGDILAKAERQMLSLKDTSGL